LLLCCARAVAVAAAVEVTPEAVAEVVAATA